MKVGAIIPCLNELDYLGPVIMSLKTAGIEKIYCISNKQGFHDTAMEKGQTKEIALKFEAEYYEGKYGNEAQTRNAFLKKLQQQKFDYALIVDADEVHDPKALECLLKKIKKLKIKPDFVKTQNMFTYFKYPTVQIFPQETLAPIILVSTKTRFSKIREIEDGAKGIIINKYPLYHFSYARPEEKIREKLSNFEHKDEVLNGWLEKKFINWNPRMKNLHPTHPSAYKIALFCPPPARVRELLIKFGSDWVKLNLKHSEQNDSRDLIIVQIYTLVRSLKLALINSKRKFFKSL